ncbi:MAG: hypothetical protein DRQ62_14360 [Gammaproteobacteria bacterium]|nr:MAG: hypothetical protein DRQ62_14360 [Gammaproteobacteria bacterium]
MNRHVILKVLLITFLTALSGVAIAGEVTATEKHGMMAKHHEMAATHHEMAIESHKVAAKENKAAAQHHGAAAGM